MVKPKTVLRYKGFEEYLVDYKVTYFNSVIPSIQYVFKFDNDYGASVIKNIGSYGYEHDLWELAVLIFVNGEAAITYDTPITHDVVGYLTDAAVCSLLSDIQALPDSGVR